MSQRTKSTPPFVRVVGSVRSSQALELLQSSFSALLLLASERRKVHVRAGCKLSLSMFVFEVVAEHRHRVFRSLSLSRSHALTLSRSHALTLSRSLGP